MTSDRILHNAKMKFVMERFGADGLLHSDLAMVIVVDIFTAVGCPVSKETALAIISNCTVKNKQFSMSLFVQWVTETFPEGKKLVLYSFH